MTTTMTDSTQPAAGPPAAEPYRVTVLPATPLYRWVLPNAGGIVALVLLPVALAAGAPLAAWALAFVMWLLNRIGHSLVGRMIDGLPKTMAVGAAGFGMMLRVWTIALVLFFVGADMHAGSMTVGFGKKDVAIAAMLLFMVVFTFDVGARAFTELRRYKTPIPEQSGEETVA